MIPRWDDQLASTQALADLAVRLAELYGLPAAPSAAQDAFPDRVTKLRAYLVQPARATALGKLGEGERAIKIAGDWLMTTLRPVPIAGQMTPNGDPPPRAYDPIEGSQEGTAW